MINAVNGNASQAYALLRTQTARGQNTPTLEEYADKDPGQVRNAVFQSSALNKPATIHGKGFATLLEAQEASTTQNSDKGTSSSIAHTIGGSVNLDEQFSNDPRPVTEHVSILDAAQQLILPTAENVKAIAAHANRRFQDLLNTYNIPDAPAQITYDNKGQIQFPADYAYTDELTQALEENPGLARELSSLNALAGHAAALQRSIAFSQEYGQASSQAQADALVAEYSDLFSDRGKAMHIALHFSADGGLSLTANGGPVNFS